MEIKNLRIEGQAKNIYTDSVNPAVSFYVDDVKDAKLKEVVVKVADWEGHFNSLLNISYKGEKLKAFTKYDCTVTVVLDNGEQASKTISFETGHMDEKWEGKYITDGEYVFKDKNISPKPMLFKKEFNFDKKVKSARLYSTAIGMYDMILNDNYVMDRYLAPGYTSYEHQLQYQVNDVTSLLKDNNTLLVYVAGGWAVGSFVMSRTNRIYADRQALKCELRVVFEDDSTLVIPSDESFEVTLDGQVKMSDIYDGETYDNSVDLKKVSFHKASFETPRIDPKLVCEYGAPVKAHETLKSVSVKTLEDGHIVYDFGQNFAGVLHLSIKNATAGQKIIVRHAEILREDGHINTALLRTAKETLTYICKEGEQEFSPRLAYFGFRYCEVEGIKEEDIKIEAFALYSDMERIGDFSCSDERINRLQQNITWSAKSNLMDIPTDCPQRDERMGWTGDIAIFSPTACYNFDVNRFLKKWLVDVKAEQLKTGAIPTTVPHKGYHFPMTFPTVACDFWGDACILVPWSLYMAYGNKDILEYMYPTMKKYVDACKFWAGLFSFGKDAYIWKNLSFIHFGDWVAPGESMAECQSRHPWTATASLYNTSHLLSEIAKILGNEEDYQKYKEMSEKTADAYESKFTDGKGKLVKKTFQTAYVLPLHFKMLKEENRKAAADNLAELVKQDDYRVKTGFPGTPYILFALADNMREDAAFKLLFQTKDPSWLHEVVTGGTSIWERFDGLDDDGKLNVPEDGTGGMISFNHYASGAVGDFLYRRVLGVEPTLPGYEEFTFKPLTDIELSHAEGHVLSPFGEIKASWKKEGEKLVADLVVPAFSKCHLNIKGQEKVLESGSYHFEF